jgi:hypothetical protein
VQPPHPVATRSEAVDNRPDGVQRLHRAPTADDSTGYHARQTKQVLMGRGDLVVVAVARLSTSGLAPAILNRGLIY